MSGVGESERKGMKSLFVVHVCVAAALPVLSRQGFAVKRSH